MKERKGKRACKIILNGEGHVRKYNVPFFH